MNLYEYEEFDDSKLYLKTVIYGFVVGFLLVLIIVSLIHFKKKTYYENELMVDNNYAITFVLKDDVHKIIDHKEIYINKKKYYYKVEEMELVNDLNTGYLVKMKIYNFDNYVNDTSLKYKVLVGKEKLFSYLLRIIGGKE